MTIKSIEHTHTQEGVKAKVAVVCEQASFSQLGLISDSNNITDLEWTE